MGMPSLLRCFLGLDLVTHHADMLGRGADKSYAVLLQDLREAGIFGQKPITRMNRVGACNLASRQEPGDVKVAFTRSWRPDAHAFVGEPDMHRIGVSCRVNGNRRYAQLFASALDAKCDLAAICNQDFIEHGAAAYSIIMSGSPYSTG